MTEANFPRRNYTKNRKKVVLAQQLGKAATLSRSTVVNPVAVCVICNFIYYRQVALADYVILNKTDLVEKEKVEEIIQTTKSINQCAPILPTTFCKLVEFCSLSLIECFSQGLIYLNCFCILKS